MTSEVIVMNKSAIALAADSAVTVSNQRDRKTYNSANKLFNMNKNKPVAIMVYGNAEVCGFPWETLIKDYRSKHAKACCNTLVDYANSFVAYCQGLKYSKADQEVSSFARFSSVFLDIYEEVQEKIDRSLRAGNSVSEQKRADIIDEQVEECKNRLESLSNSSSFESVSFKEASILMRRPFKAAVKHVFETWNLTTRNRKGLFYIAYLSIVKKNYSDSRSGIVIAGFGDDELFPSAISYYVDGAFDGNLKIDIEKSHIISDSNSVLVRAFAQDDMVYRFMEGIDRDYQKFLMINFRGVMSVLSKNFGSLFFKRKKKQEEVKALLEDAVDRIFRRLEERVQNHRFRKFVQPILETVRILPKDEMAVLAESLVHLTSLRRRVSSELETVGGPIDVAVISKGDGFVWIKRKHYFNPSLNPAFLQTYLDR